MDEDQSKQENEKKLSRDEQIENWKKEILDNKEMQTYFSAFKASSIESFVKYYVSEKYYWVNYGTRELLDMENEVIQWEDIAFKHLGLIQQKKLFDAQCLWRAEQLEIKELKLCCQFGRWENDILNCPFIEPVTNHDIERYSNFLLNPVYWDLENENWSDIYHDFDSVKMAGIDSNNANVNFPEWYEYHNMVTGNGTLLLLPDVRQEKEEFYRDIYFNDRNEKEKADGTKIAHKVDERPYLGYYNLEEVENFVSKFENKEIQSLYEAWEWGRRTEAFKLFAEEYIELLYYADEKIPIEANSDWKEAIKIAYVKYRRQKIVDALPLAFEQYRMTIDSGIKFPSEEKDNDQWLFEIYEEQITKGRILNGEPGDLNF